MLGPGPPGEPWPVLPPRGEQCLACSLLPAGRAPGTFFPFKEPCEAGAVSCQPGPDSTDGTCTPGTRPVPIPECSRC